MTDDRADAADGHVRRPSRRTVIKGAAWSLPVIAASMAVPAHAASVSCAPGDATTIATADASGLLEVTIPACATEITYVVRGGGGGGSATYGGFGAVSTGTIVPTGQVMTLYLIAGQGGWARGSSKVDVHPQGFGAGGLGATRYNFNGSGVWAVDAGYGGAGSAILLGSPAGAPIVVAGGGGGSGNAMASGNGNGVLLQAIAGDGGNAGQTALSGGSGTLEGGGTAGGGGAATLSAAGAGGVPSGPYTNIAGDSGNGRDGGSGTQVRLGPSGGTTGATSGGGGGGYFGGGGGSVVWEEQFVSGAGGGGGAGTSYIDNAYAAGVIDSSFLDNTGNGAPGMVTISWT